ncbi:type II secretion system protein [Vibrio ishigakensis]|uniref:type II secretion system protein n=1 Tax=Vibrio ishigakensis TaxID=1481914 RepID=UPI0021C4AB8A|nr:type II secretion system protein [Vibrio ishigakensis]
MIDKNNKTKRTFGFTLIELIVVLVVLGTLAVVALPRFLNYSVDSRIATLETIAGRVQEAVQNAQAIKNIDDRVYKNGSEEYLRFSPGVDLLLTNGQMDGGEYCHAIGLLDKGLAKNKDANSPDGKYRCKYENNQKSFIQDNALSQEECYISISVRKHLAEPLIELSCKGNTSECLCP